VNVPRTDFKDNQPTLDLLELKGTGLFPMLDEEVHVAHKQTHKRESRGKQGAVTWGTTQIKCFDYGGLMKVVYAIYPSRHRFVSPALFISHFLSCALHIFHRICQNHHR